MKKILITFICSLFLVSCGWGDADVINPDAKYLYFYWATCPHCQELNKKLEEVWGIEQYPVEKREVYYNKENQTAFQEIITQYNIPQKDAGVPFVLEKATGEFVVGSQPSFEMMTWQSYDTQEAIPETPNVLQEEIKTE